MGKNVEETRFHFADKSLHLVMLRGASRFGLAGQPEAFDQRLLEVARKANIALRFIVAACPQKAPAVETSRRGVPSRAAMWVAPRELEVRGVRR